MDIYKAKVTDTGERLKVYKLANNNWYDYDAMEQDKAPTAVKAGKKMFSAGELQLNKKPIKS